jgi:sterol desaturase/sphingolipid hydroxylase (fatty acid hydroxylase superfamily)
VTALLLYPLLTTAMYYLLARAEITRFLWSRYSPRVDRFMACAACTGFWYGLAVAIWGRYAELTFMALSGDAYYTPLVIGLCSMIWTPVVAWLHLAALDRLGMPEHEEPPNT